MPSETTVDDDEIASQDYGGHSIKPPIFKLSTIDPLILPTLPPGGPLDPNATDSESDLLGLDMKKVVKEYGQLFTV